MTEAQREQKKIQRIEGLKFMQEMQTSLGNTTRAEMMQSQIDKLTLKLKQNIMGFRYNSNEDIKVALKDSNGIRLTYELMHIKNNIINNYVIQAKIGGLLDCKERSLFIIATSCERLNNNEETMTDEYAIDLLEDYLQEQLLNALWITKYMLSLKCCN